MNKLKGIANDQSPLHKNLIEHKQEKSRLINHLTVQSVKITNHKLLEIQKNNDKLLKNLTKISVGSNKNRLMTTQFIQDPTVETQSQKSSQNKFLFDTNRSQTTFRPIARKSQVISVAQQSQEMTKPLKSLETSVYTKTERKSVSVESLFNEKNRPMSLNIVNRKLEAERIVSQNRLLTERIIFTYDLLFNYLKYDYRDTTLSKSKMDKDYQKHNDLVRRLSKIKNNEKSNQKRYQNHLKIFSFQVIIIIYKGMSWMIN